MAESGFKLPAAMDARLRIEMIADKVTRSLYSTADDPVGLAGAAEKAAVTALLERELAACEQGLSPDQPAVNLLYVHAVRVHLRLAVFFDAPTRRAYHDDLLRLYLAVNAFVDRALDLRAGPIDPAAVATSRSAPPSASSTSPSSASAAADAGPVIARFATNYLQQTLIAAGFALLKLLNHGRFARLIDVRGGALRFARTVHGIRATSVAPNDLPSRLAEVLAQLWRASRAGRGEHRDRHASGSEASDEDGDKEEEEEAESLQLKVRCRMSMSLVYDTVWRWREEILYKGRGNLDCEYTILHPLLIPRRTSMSSPPSLRSHSDLALQPSPDTRPTQTRPPPAAPTPARPRTRAPPSVPKRSPPARPTATSRRRTASSCPATTPCSRPPAPPRRSRAACLPRPASCPAPSRASPSSTTRSSTRSAGCSTASSTCRASST